MSLPWIEKYRPSRLDKIVSHQHIVEVLKRFIQNKNFPNLILFGSSGVGKTSLIHACANELFGKNTNLMTLEINASEERGIDIIRTRITQFSGIQTTFEEVDVPIKLVILDEADSMTVDAQLALKNVIDTYSKTTRFCLICNCIKKIHYSLISRCTKFRLQPLRKSQIKEYVKSICELEGINISDLAIDEILKYSNGDMRRILNLLQAIHTTYKRITPECISNYLNKIPKDLIVQIFLSIIQKPIDASFEAIRSLIHENSYSFNELLRNLNDLLIEQLSGNQIIQLDDIQIFEMMKCLGKIEYQSSSNVNILIASLVSSIKCIFNKK